MNSKRTWILLTLAAALFAFIFFFERHINRNPSGPPPILPGLKAADIRSIHVQPKGQRAIHAVRTESGWTLQEPIEYPANSERIEQMLEALTRTTATPYLSLQDLKSIPDWDTQFGFDSPQWSLMLGQKRHLILIGRKTPSGDRVYLQVVGVDGVFVVDAALLDWIPPSPNIWRRTALLDSGSLHFDRIMVTNAGKLLELQIDSTNQIWRMLSPNNVRADSAKVRETLELLGTLQVNEFVSDESMADLETYGLQPPELSVSLLNGTNRVVQIDFGRSPTNDPALVYARRADQTTVVTVSKRYAEPWLSAQSHSYRDFFDPRLIVLSQPLDEIEVHADEKFTLNRDSERIWSVNPPGHIADPGLMQQVLQSLTNLQVTAAQIEKDIVPAADLPKYGLAEPFRRYVLKVQAGNGAKTNLILASLDFGTNANRLFARVSGESFVYAMDPGILNLFPTAGWQMRDRRIWSFSPDDVASLAIQQNGKTRQLLRKGEKNWALAPGSQGIMDELIAAQLDEAVVRLGDLSAAYWVQRGDANLETYGFKETAYRISVSLKSGETLSVDFGREAPSQFPYAMTVLDGQTWVFEFPWTVFQFVQLYLSIPSGPF